MRCIASFLKLPMLLMMSIWSGCCASLLQDAVSKLQQREGELSKQEEATQRAVKVCAQCLQLTCLHYTVASPVMFPASFKYSVQLNSFWSLGLRDSAAELAVFINNILATAAEVAAVQQELYGVSYLLYSILQIARSILSCPANPDLCWASVML